MVFRNLEVDFDVFDADDMDAYLEALEKVKETHIKAHGERGGDAIRRVCQGIFTFFDDLLGEGTSKELFGEKTNMMTCMVAYREFIDAVDEQKAVLDDMVSEIHAKNKAKVETNGNRATRRATKRK